MKWTVPAFLLLAVGAAPEAAQAGWREFFQQCHVDAQRMNCWPDPFRHTDEALNRAPFEVHIQAGWRLENTLVAPLFDEGHELTLAGKLKVRHILTQVPAHRRSIYVAQGQSPEVTERRVDAVQRAVADILPTGPMPPVLVTAIEPRGGTGDYLNVVTRKYREAIPAPVLPQAETSGGSGGTSN